MSPVRLAKLRRALNAAAAQLAEIERLLSEAEGVARVVKRAKAKKGKPRKMPAKRAKKPAGRASKSR